MDRRERAFLDRGGSLVSSKLHIAVHGRVQSGFVKASDQIDFDRSLLDHFDFRDAAARSEHPSGSLGGK